jgi:hypothetical protein
MYVTNEQKGILYIEMLQCNIIIYRYSYYMQDGSTLFRIYIRKPHRLLLQSVVFHGEIAQ